MGIENAHRVGPKKSRKNERPRAIIVKFFHLEEKEAALMRSNQIKEMCNIFVDEDFPPEIEERRRTLKPIVVAAKKVVRNGKHQYSANLNVDKLTINGKRYTADTTDELPDELKLKNIFTPTRGSTTAFFTTHSPLSNHYMAEQQVDNRTFNCNEQFYMFMKATKFNDHETAKKIMQTTNPGHQKGLGSNIKNFKEDVWRESCIDIMRTGLQAKFNQNPDLEQFLLDTGSNMLIEGNAKDSYWGAGLSIHNPKIWKKHAWWGIAENHLGRLLQEVRLECKRDESNSG